MKHINNFFKDKNGNVVLFQPANLPLIMWLVFTLIGFVLPAGSVKDIVRLVALIILVVWASMEIYSGVNGFRRTLGFVVLVSAVISLNKLLFSFE